MTLRSIDLLSSTVRLGRDGTVHVAKDAPGPDQDGWRLAAFHAKSGTDVRTDHWEVCPESDKLVSCLIGMIRLCLRPEPGAAEEEVRLTAGTAAVVPRGRWHRIKLDVPSTIITVALPRGTLLEERTEGASPVLFSAGT
ncbi:cupin [Actinomadura rupiterrae]|uniref:cupin n=1 Tax=Actinomadura rupiterrae TaxID=559627 RepID=UPI0020A3C6B3|nr:cupin [Actinomadura rupiterrae]MCP2342781.1 hypothetical protein [Actinomadura rupiterrae]